MRIHADKTAHRRSYEFPFCNVKKWIFITSHGILCIKFYCAENWRFILPLYLFIRVSQWPFAWFPSGQRLPQFPYFMRNQPHEPQPGQPAWKMELSCEDSKLSRVRVRALTVYLSVWKEYKIPHQKPLLHLFKDTYLFGSILPVILNEQKAIKITTQYYCAISQKCNEPRYYFWCLHPKIRVQYACLGEFPNKCVITKIGDKERGSGMWADTELYGDIIRL